MKTAPSKSYPLSPDLERDLKIRFTYHPPQDDQQERYVRLRLLGYSLAKDIVEMTPPSREQSLALTHLEEAIFQANAAIARRESLTPLST
jgi:hypothetical protein